MTVLLVLKQFELAPSCDAQCLLSFPFLLLLFFFFYLAKVAFMWLSLITCWCNFIFWIFNYLFKLKDILASLSFCILLFITNFFKFVNYRICMYPLKLKIVGCGTRRMQSILHAPCCHDFHDTLVDGDPEGFFFSVHSDCCEWPLFLYVLNLRTLCTHDLPHIGSWLISFAIAYLFVFLGWVHSDTSGMVRKTGGNFKEKLRELGGLDAVFEVTVNCHSVMEVWVTKT